MAVIIKSANPVTLVGGVGVVIEGLHRPKAVTTDDVYKSNDPGTPLSSLLSDLPVTKCLLSTTIDATVAGNKVLYTTPTSQSLILIQMAFALDDIRGSGATPLIDVGYVGTFKQFIDS